MSVEIVLRSVPNTKQNKKRNVSVLTQCTKIPAPPPPKCLSTIMSRSSVVGITCSSVGLSTRFFILIICIIVLTSLVLVLLLSSLFLFIKMLKNSKHAQNLMAFIYNCLSITLFQEDSVHFPPELTDPALLAEVNYFSVQRFACSSYKMTCLEHQLKTF